MEVKEGKWSFDSENRKKLPKDIKLPKQPIFKETEHTKKLKKIINEKFSKHPGDTESILINNSKRCKISFR